MIERCVVHLCELRLALNDLDFCYLPRVSSAVSLHASELVCTVDSSSFFVNGGHHIVVALDCEGGQGAVNPHCGPIERDGENLWALARGFIVLADGAVMAEHWAGTASPVLAPVSNTAGVLFDPVRHPVFTLRIVAGYRAGAWANTMQIEIRAGETAEGSLLFAGTITGPLWGCDWTGSSRAALAGIALGFVPPQAPDCMEPKVPRSAPNAVVSVSQVQFQMCQAPPAAPPDGCSG